jgi:hypothetical protein
MAGQVDRRLAPEHGSPSRPQRFDIEIAQACDLVFQRYGGLGVGSNRNRVTRPPWRFALVPH